MDFVQQNDDEMNNRKNLHCNYFPTQRPSPSLLFTQRQWNNNLSILLSIFLLLYFTNFILFLFLIEENNPPIGKHTHCNDITLQFQYKLLICSYLCIVRSYTLPIHFTQLKR